MNATPRIALLAGASGLVGSYLLKVLLDQPDYSRVFALTRRPLGKEHPRLANRVIVNFEHLGEQLKNLVAHDAFCCVGTTIGSAGTQEAFRQVDVDAVMHFANAARAAGCQRFVVVSSVGADVSSTNFYLRTKGEMEEAIQQVGFTSVDILQPSLLLGSRKQLRPAEITGRFLSPIINPFLTGAREAYRSIPAETVALAMLGAARRGARGVQRYTWAAIRQLAELRAPQPNLAPKKPPA